MDEKLLQELKKELQTEKEKTIEELSLVSSPDAGDHVAGDNNPKFPNYGDDTPDNPETSPNEVEDFEVNVDVTNKLQTKLDAIDEALEKMKKDEYGICEKCGKAINPERLKVNPAALICTKCA